MNHPFNLLLLGLYSLSIQVLLGCVNIPIDQTLNSSSMYYQDSETKKFIISSMGWDNLLMTTENKCQRAQKTAHQAIRKKLAKDISTDVIKKDRFYDEKNDLCVVLLSVKVAQDDVNPDLAHSANATPSTSYYTKRTKIEFSTPPIYPIFARKNGIEGTVILQLIVSLSGDPLNITISKTSGYPMLDQEALRTVKDWRFQPAEINGTPIMSRVNIPIAFELSY